MDTQSIMMVVKKNRGKLIFKDILIYYNNNEKTN
jgi:hypothetical protein